MPNNNVTDGNVRKQNGVSVQSLCRRMWKLPYVSLHQLDGPSTNGKTIADTVAIVTVPGVIWAVEVWRTVSITIVSKYAI